MIRPLTNSDVEAARQTLLAEILVEGPKASGERTQPFSGVMETVLLQALIPILVSVTSAILAEIIKGKALSSLRRGEAEKAISELLAQQINPKAALRSDCLDELRRVLGPFGLSDEKIRDLYHKVARGMEKKPRSRVRRTLR